MKSETIGNDIVEVIADAKKTLELYFEKYFKWHGDYSYDCGGYWCGCDECVSSKRHEAMIEEFIELCDTILGLEFDKVRELFKSSTGYELVEKSDFYDERYYYFKVASNRIFPFFEEMLVYNFFKNEADAGFFLSLFKESRRLKKELKESEEKIKNMESKVSEAIELKKLVAQKKKDIIKACVDLGKLG
ncbi:MAG: hypothetical protein WAV73_02500 [Candidatus Moraniibacteriota bacterium]